MMRSPLLLLLGVSSALTTALCHAPLLAAAMPTHQNVVTQAQRLQPVVLTLERKQ